MQLLRADNLATRGAIDEAVLATDRVSKVVRQRMMMLMGAFGASLQNVVRTSMQREMDVANWTLQRIQGQIAIRQEDYRKAVSLLQTALDAQIPVREQERLAAAELVAIAYQQLGLHDLAATAYERAVLLAPQRNEYRILAARSWTAAGDDQRALQQWKGIQGDSLDLALARTQAVINEQLSLPPNSRDFREAQQGIDRLRKMLESLSPEQEKNRSQYESQVELLALAITERADGKERAAAIDRLKALAEKTPENAELQRVAALALAITGRKEEMQARLAALAEKSGKDSWLYVECLARIHVIQDDHASAMNELEAFAKSNAKESMQALTLAADIAQAKGDNPKALALLSQISAAELTPDLMFRMFNHELANWLNKSQEKRVSRQTFKHRAN